MLQITMPTLASVAEGIAAVVLCGIMQGRLRDRERFV